MAKRRMKRQGGDIARRWCCAAAVRDHGIGGYGDVVAWDFRAGLTPHLYCISPVSELQKDKKEHGDALGRNEDTRRDRLFLAFSILSPVQSGRCEGHAIAGTAETCVSLRSSDQSNFMARNIKESS